MTPRLAVALAAAAVTLAGTPAFAAAAKPACRLIIDDAGDAQVAGSNRPSIDILTADVASGKKNLVGVLRLASLATDPLMSAGATYTLSWVVNGKAQAFTLTQYSDGSRDVKFDPDGAFGASSDEIDTVAVVDAATATITWSLPRKIDSALKPGAKISSLAAATTASFNIRVATATTSGSFLGGDDASTGKSYVDGAPTCVKGV